MPTLGLCRIRALPSMLNFSHTGSIKLHSHGRPPAPPVLAHIAYIPAPFHQGSILTETYCSAKRQQQHRCRKSGRGCSRQDMQSDDDEEMQHRQERCEIIQNAHPQLSGTSLGDSGSRSSALSSARVHEDMVSASGIALGRSRQLWTRILIVVPSRLAVLHLLVVVALHVWRAGCSLGRSFYIGAVAGALRCSKSP